MSNRNPSNRRRQPVRRASTLTGGSTTLRAQQAQKSAQSAPPNYDLDYAYVRRDLTLIAIIGGTLFALMIAASFVF